MKKLLWSASVAAFLFAGVAAACGSCNVCNSCGGYVAPAPVVYVDPAPYYNYGPLEGLAPTYDLHRCVWVDGRYNYYGFYVPGHSVCWNDSGY